MKNFGYSISLKLSDNAILVKLVMIYSNEETKWKEHLQLHETVNTKADVSLRGKRLHIFVRSYCKISLLVWLLHTV